MDNEVLIILFDQLCKDVKARDYVKYLFKNLLSSKFDLNSISTKVALEVLGQISAKDFTNANYEEIKTNSKW